MSSTNVCVAIANPKSPSNMGSVLRAAGCFNVDEIRYSGTRYDKAAQFQTDTKDHASRIPMVNRGDLTARNTSETQVVCVELVENAVPLDQFEHPKHAIYLFGPEDSSLTQADINNADHVVYIPTVGCLNLAATVNIVLYDRQAKLGGVIASNQTVISSRDRNNNLSA